MAAFLYLTSPTVRSVTVLIETLVAFGPDDTLPGITRLVTTRGTVRVLEDAETIHRLLGNDPSVLSSTGLCG